MERCESRGRNRGTRRRKTDSLRDEPPRMDRTARCAAPRCRRDALVPVLGSPERALPCAPPLVSDHAETTPPHLLLTSSAGQQQLARRVGAVARSGGVKKSAGLHLSS